MTFNFLRGPNSGHLDMARMGWGASIVSALGFTGAHLYLNHAFDIMQFGTGMGVLLAGGGAAITAKDVGVATAIAKAGTPDSSDGGTQ